MVSLSITCINNFVSLCYNFNVIVILLKISEVKRLAKKSDSFFGKELWGMVLMLVSAFLLFSLITGNNIFYPVGGIIKTFLLGTAGYFSFPLLVMILG